MRRAFALRSTIRSALRSTNAAMCAACGISGRSIGTSCAAATDFTGTITVTHSSSAVLMSSGSTILVGA